MVDSFVHLFPKMQYVEVEYIPPDTSLSFSPDFALLEGRTGISKYPFLGHFYRRSFAIISLCLVTYVSPIVWLNR
jgi:hypothetical protein